MAVEEVEHHGGGVRSSFHALDGDLTPVGRESELHALKVVAVVKDEVDADEVGETCVVIGAELLDTSLASHPISLLFAELDCNFGGCGWRLEDVNTLSILHSIYIATS
jgi:hypothetical protein